MTKLTERPFDKFARATLRTLETAGPMNCSTCAHRQSLVCLRTGITINHMRLQVTNGVPPARAACDIDFSGWVPRPRRWWMFWRWLS